jgi:hypothetical protein
MADKLAYLANGQIEIIEGVPEFRPELMSDSNLYWRFEVVGYQDDSGSYVLRRFGDNIITDQHPRVVPSQGEIGQLIKKTDSGVEWATPVPEDADAEPYMGNPSEDGLYFMSGADGRRTWGTGSEDPPLTVKQFQKIAIIMELIQ